MLWPLLVCLSLVCYDLLDVCCLLCVVCCVLRLCPVSLFVVRCVCCVLFVCGLFVVCCLWLVAYCCLCVGCYSLRDVVRYLSLTLL